ncbi:MAG: hypothetical protein AB1798_17480 [Spirochaetota bacterium]
MNRILVVLVLFLAPLLIFADGPESYTFLDGFTLSIYGNYTINILDDSTEEVITLISEVEEPVYGFIFYDEDKWSMAIKDQIILLSRDIFRDDIADDMGETIQIYFDYTLSNNLCYWIEMSIADTVRKLMAVDLRQSPGFAAFILFYFDPETSIGSDEQDALLYDIYSNLEIYFEEAAG